MVANLLQWLFHVFVSRGLGPAGYGAYVAVLSVFVVIVYPLSALQMAVADRTSRYHAVRNRAAIGGLLHRMLLGVFVSLVVIALLIAFFGSILVTKWKLHADQMWVLGMLVVAAILMTVVRGLLQGLQRFVALGLNIFIDSFVRCLGGIVLVYLMHLGVTAALGSSIISAFIAGLCGVWLLRNYFLMSGRMESRELKRMFLAFLPMLLTMFFFGVMTNVDILVVRATMNGVDSGYYGAAHKVGEILIYVPMAIVGVMFPKVSACSEQNKKTRHLLFLSLGYAAVICLGGGVFCLLFPEFVTKIIFGGDFLPGAWMVRLFPFVFIPFSLANVVVNYLIARGRFAFGYLMGGVIVLYLGALWLFHATVVQIMWVEFITGMVLLLSLLVFGQRPGKLQSG